MNEAAGVLWVTDVEGPPPDSDAAEDHFTCGIEGMEEAAYERYCRFRGSVDCVGSWHTHPTSTPHPSDVDISTVAQILTGSSRRTCLVLILSGNPDDPALGAHAFRTKLSRREFYSCPTGHRSDSTPRATARKATETWGLPSLAEDRALSRSTLDAFVPCTTSIFSAVFR